MKKTVKINEEQLRKMISEAVSTIYGNETEGTKDLLFKYLVGVHLAAEKALAHEEDTDSVKMIETIKNAYEYCKRFCELWDKIDERAL